MGTLKEGVEVLPGLISRLLDEKDLPQINELLANNYSYRHPLRHVFKFTKEDVGDYDVRAAKENLKSNASLGSFVKETGELVHVELNTVHDKTQDSSNFIPTSSERLSSYLRFVKYVLGDVFSDLNTNRYLYGSMACVRSDYRSSGVFSGLKQVRMELAKARGCEYVVSVSSSLYTQKAAKSGGYTVLREVPFVDYIDPKTGLKPDLKLSPIHTSGQLVYKRFPPDAGTKHGLKSKI